MFDISDIHMAVSHLFVAHIFFYKSDPGLGPRPQTDNSQRRTPPMPFKCDGGPQAREHVYRVDFWHTFWMQVCSEDQCVYDFQAN